MSESPDYYRGYQIGYEQGYRVGYEQGRVEGFIDGREAKHAVYRGHGCTVGDVVLYLVSMILAGCAVSVAYLILR